jgi:hypothetical protein
MPGLNVCVPLAERLTAHFNTRATSLPLLAIGRTASGLETVLAVTLIGVLRNPALPLAL